MFCEFGNNFGVDALKSFGRENVAANDGWPLLTGGRLLCVAATDGGL